MKVTPSYRKLWADGELAARAEEAQQRLEACDMCAHECRVNRLEGKKGFCLAGNLIEISSYGPHFGEEDVLVGRRGSGTIFLTGCNLRCIFCQNYDISHLRDGYPVSLEEFAAIMIRLQDRGCHNINLVTPTHFLPQILAALELACPAGLSIPLVWNCGGFESETALRLLDGVVDIYMPDVKFSDSAVAARLTGARGYWEAAQNALREMHRQVGDLAVDSAGIAYRGLLVRHLVLPGNLAGTESVLRFIAEEISPQTYVNIMSQYHPAYQAHLHPPLDRRITRQEYMEALEIAKRVGLTRLA
ncbi:MAG TPA: radical SAM protein [Firmicutes bacterium]|nr:radical SAM protein [Bacillota bacterium]